MCNSVCVCWLLKFDRLNNEIHMCVNVTHIHTRINIPHIHIRTITHTHEYIHIMCTNIPGHNFCAVDSKVELPHAKGNAVVCVCVCECERDVNVVSVYRSKYLHEFIRTHFLDHFQSLSITNKHTRTLVVNVLKILVIC
jgi:hypothetical protein